MRQSKPNNRNLSRYETSKMLAYVCQVREHNETDQRPIQKKKINTTNGVVAFKYRSTRNNVLSVFFVAAPKSRSVYIGPRSTIHLSGPHKNIPHEFHVVYLSPQTKPGCTSKGRCDYQGIGVSSALLCGCNNCAGY